MKPVIESDIYGCKFTSPEGKKYVLIFEGETHSYRLIDKIKQFLHIRK